jgi:hypothetical protein
MCASVRGAVSSFRRTVTVRPPVVPVSVQTANVPPTLVYNLTLARHNAYYANGILVFNCADALAMTFAFPVPVRREQQSAEELEPEAT